MVSRTAKIETAPHAHTHTASHPASFPFLLVFRAATAAEEEEEASFSSQITDFRILFSLFSISTFSVAPAGGVAKLWVQVTHH